MYVAENLLFATVLVVALLPLIVLFLRGGRRSVHVLGLAFLALVLRAATVDRSAPDVELTRALPVPNVEDGMRNSGTCLGCHPGEYTAWYASFHRTMTQVAGPDTVVAPFDGRKLEARGRAFVVEPRGEEFWITEVQPGKRSSEVVVKAAERVVMTTGSRHQQIYWTAGPNGGLTQVPWVYTFHKAASSGSRCYNCHMPYTSYALLGAARAHRVDSPVVLGQGTTDRPTQRLQSLSPGQDAGLDGGLPGEVVRRPRHRFGRRAPASRGLGALDASRRRRAALARRLAHGTALGARSVGRRVGDALPGSAFAGSVFRRSHDRSPFPAASRRRDDAVLRPHR